MNQENGKNTQKPKMNWLLLGAGIGAVLGILAYTQNWLG